MKDHDTPDIYKALQGPITAGMMTPAFSLISEEDIMNRILTEQTEPNYIQSIKRSARGLGKTMGQVAAMYSKSVPKVSLSPVTKIEQDVLHDAVSYCNAIGVNLQWFISNAVRTAINDSIENEGLEDAKRCQHCFCINEIEAEKCIGCCRPVGE